MAANIKNKSFHQIEMSHLSCVHIINAKTNKSLTSVIAAKTKMEKKIH